MSNVANIEQRARELDEIRRSKAIRKSDIDEDLYAEPEDLSKSVITSNAVIDQMWQDILQPKKDNSSVMPWQKTHSTFRFRPGEVTLYAGSNGGGKSLVTGQIALGLMQQGHKVCIASFEMKPKRTMLRMLGSSPERISMCQCLANRFCTSTLRGWRCTPGTNSGSTISREPSPLGR